MKLFKDYSLLHDNTFSIDQKCDEFLVYEDAEEAALVAQTIRSGEVMMILGGGSNVLFTQDFHGKVITPAKRFEVEWESAPSDSDMVNLRCWAGTTFDDAVAYAVKHGFYGMENLSLIPGECGASVIQNIGAYGVEAKDIIIAIEAVEIATGKAVTIDVGECKYGYRESRFKHEWKNKYLVTYVTYRLSRTFRPHLDYGNIRAVLAQRNISEQHLTAQQLRDIIIDIRREKLPDPTETGNAGSFFMNPVVDEHTFRRLQGKFPHLRYFEVDGAEKSYKIPAGWMIEQCGWKGKALGRAGVHDKQALVLVNRGGATGAEIVALMYAVQQDVYNMFGLEIKPEVNIL